MKKITLLLTAFIIGVTAQAQITLTQSIDPVTVDSGGVACWASGTGEYRANSFFRAYDLADFGVTGSFEVSSVEFGQGSADDGKEVTLNIYTADNIDLSVATLTLIAATTHVSSSADDLTLVSEPLSASIPAGSIVVFEVFAADSGTTINQRYFPGLNGAGENGPSYLMAADCGVTTPTPVGVVTGVDEYYVMNVIGDEVLGANDILANQSSIYPNPVSDILNVKLPSNVEVLNAELVDVLGKNTGVSFNNGEMNVAALAQGLYILNVKTTAGTLTQKIVKN